MYLETIILIILVIIGILLKLNIVCLVRVSGRSMIPTLYPNELYGAYRPLRSWQRFDIVIFPNPTQPNKLVVKRIIGLPGECVEYHDDQLYINHQFIEEPFLEPIKQATPPERRPLTRNLSTEDAEEGSTIPEGYAFVLGDNRKHSVDSRAYHSVPMNTFLKLGARLYPFKR